VWELHPDDAASAERVAAAERVLEATVGGASVEELADEGRARGQLALRLAHDGRPEDALPHARRALEIWTELGRARAILLARLRLAELDARLGDLVGARAEVLEVLDDPGSAPYVFSAHILLARVASESRDPEAVRAHVAAALDFLVARGVARRIDTTRALGDDLLAHARRAPEHDQ
jgi:tetratricopeptide (TPR) repeat protein